MAAHLGPLPPTQPTARPVSQALARPVAEAWPSKLCEWLAQLALAGGAAAAATVSSDKGGVVQPKPSLGYVINSRARACERERDHRASATRLMGRRTSVMASGHAPQAAGRDPGEDMQTILPGKWLREKLRDNILAKVDSEEELEQEAFRMAKDGEKGCNLVRDGALQEDILELPKTWIEGQD